MNSTRKIFLKNKIFEHYNEKQVLINFLYRVERKNIEYLPLIHKYLFLSIPNKYESIIDIYCIHFLKKTLTHYNEIDSIIDNFDEYYNKLNKKKLVFSNDIIISLSDLTNHDAAKTFYGIIDEIEETGSEPLIETLDAYLKYMWGGEAEE